jgi:nucleotide-binding universal stress UspA family protein
MYKKILVPLDGSKTAEHALPLARSFARALQLPVELLAVVDIAEVARNVTADQSSMLRTLVDDTNRRLIGYLEGVAKNFPAGAVHHSVRTGSAAEVIVESAAADNETLIAMATHGRSGLDRWLLGSVAEKVLRAAANPLLLVRAVEQAPLWEMATLKRVIVPLDGSELSERILPFVESLAKRLGLEVVLLGVYGGPVSSGAAGDGLYNTAQIEAFVAGVRAETVEYLAAKAEEMKRRGFAKISTLAKEGLSADEIIAVARETPDTLIAMCTHGRSGVKRWMLGSVTETVVRHSGAPVLVVRPS